jgi:arsenic resistance protein ArsH
MRVEDQPVYDSNLLHPIDFAALAGLDDAGHPPRILLLYGSLRPQSYSRASVEEGARVLRALGCETKLLDPTIGDWRHAPNTGKNFSVDAGLWWVTIV